MTLDDFLIKFEEIASKAKWELRLGEIIRTTDGYCPICYLGKELGLNEMELKTDHENISYNLNMSVLTTIKIATAADFIDSDSEVRNQLLQITGLQ